MKGYIERTGMVIAMFIVVLGLAVPSVSAEERSATDPKPVATERQKQTEQLQRQKAAEAQQKVAEIRAEAKQRLDDTKRRVCATHQANINKQMSRVVEQRQKQINHISEIATRVQDFYVKQGHVLANYDALVSDVTVKKAAAQAALDATKSGATFDCNGDGPKAELQAFRDKRTIVVAAIKDYRQSVKKLIAGVKSVQPDREEQ